MYADKRYLQYNDLVFDSYDMLRDYRETTNFKGSAVEYSYTDGSYMPFKSDRLFVSEATVTMTIALKLKKIACDQRMNYVKFAERELSKPGRLWAIKHNEIIWAFAATRNINPVATHKKTEVEYDLEFIIPGGVWHKADKQRTFLLPYDICSIMDCKDFRDYNPCVTSTGGGDCCEACEDNQIEMQDRCGCCCEDDVTADMALCYHQKELQRFYSCDTPYQLLYNCEKAKQFSTEPALGQRLCVKDVCNDSVISGRFYSDTDLSTQDVTITLVGDMKNPWITINENTNIIEGEYSGKLIIEPSGDVYYQPNECCAPVLLDPSVWTRPKGMDYGWTIYPGMNGVTIYTNACCSQSGMACVYIDSASITI